MCRGAAANVAHAKENNVQAWSKHLNKELNHGVVDLYTQGFV
jgi:hypothetical protein